MTSFMLRPADGRFALRLAAPGGLSGETLGLLALIVLKLSLLAAFGPSAEPDWNSYTAFADIILGHSTPQNADWLTNAGLAREALPLTIFRSIGYPLVVAAFRWLLGSGPAHLYAILIVQMALSLLATVVVWRLALVLLRSRPLALLAAGAHATAATLIYDQSLLSDSIFNSLFILGWAVPLLGLLRQNPPPLPHLAALGAALGYSCLERGNGLLFAPLLVLSVMVWIWRRPGLPARLAGAALYLAPAVAMVGGDMAWNHARCGHWIMTTGAQNVLIQALIKAAGRGHDMFDGNTPIDALARQELRTFQYNEIHQIETRLFTDYHLDAVASARLHERVYLAAWRRHPGAMLENTVHNCDNTVIFQFFNPAENISQYMRVFVSHRPFQRFGQAWKALLGGDLQQGVWLLATPLCNVVSYAFFIILAVGGPWLALRLLCRKRFSSPAQAAVLWLRLVFFAYTLVMCAIHLELRYEAAASAAGQIASLALVQSLATEVRAHRTRSSIMRVDSRGLR
jgi:hypothetical protein